MIDLMSLYATILPTPKPADLTPPGIFTKDHENIISTWDAHVGPSDRDGTGDYEDFWEHAYALHAVCQYAENHPSEHVWLSVREGNPKPATPATPKRTHDELKEAITSGEVTHYGYISVMSDLNLTIETDASRYHLDPAFHEYAGRQLHLCCGEEPDPDDYLPNPDGSPPVTVAEGIVALAESGATQAVVKANRVKHGLWTVPASTDRETAEKTAYDAMDMSLYYLGNNWNSFLVQEHVNMRYEYRVYIVDRTPVTGAGCIEEFTPLNNTAVFDPMMRENRRTDPGEALDVPERLPDLARRYTEFAAKFAAETTIEADYVLDLAVNNQNEILVVELNSLFNTGMYASNPYRVVSALTG